MPNLEEITRAKINLGVGVKIVTENINEFITLKTKINCGDRLTSVIKMIQNIEPNSNSLTRQLGNDI
jgi:hypothetical protein